MERVHKKTATVYAGQSKGSDRTGQSGSPTDARGKDRFRESTETTTDVQYKGVSERTKAIGQFDDSKQAQVERCLRDKERDFGTTDHRQTATAS